MRIGVLGGTGPAGQGIALRLAAAGHHVCLGSRDLQRAAGVTDECKSQWPQETQLLESGSNGDAAEADLVVLATVWDAVVQTAQEHAQQLAGKVVVSVANGLRRQGSHFVPVLSPAGSIAAEVQLVTPGASVAAALHLVPAAPLSDLSRPLAGDVLVVGDAAARPVVMELISGMRALRALDAGPLANAIGLEAFTAALLNVNKNHRGEASLHLEGVPDPA